ncbi:hypothetical protein DUNSADRAFT_12340, partial [Dunaliella salina]
HSRTHTRTHAHVRASAKPYNLSRCRNVPCHRAWNNFPFLCVHRKPRELRNHVRRMGHVLFCMARYIGYGPESVRYCVYTKGGKELPEGITDPKCTPECGGQWGEVNETNFKPALKPRDLSNIDKILQKDDKVVQ